MTASAATDVLVEPAPETAPAEDAEEQFVHWRPRTVERVRQAWRSRHLIKPLAQRRGMLFPDYSQTLLGKWWLLIRPGMDIFGKTLIFGGVFGARAPNGVPYFLFVMIGMQGWRLFQRTIVWETRSFRRFNRMTKNLNLPLLLVPVVATAHGLFEFVFYGSFIAVALGYYWIADGVFYLTVGPNLLWAVLGLALILLFSLSVGLFLSVLNAKAQDVRFSMRYVLELWMYSTPVMYSLQTIPHRFQLLALANPLTPLMEIVKLGFLGAGQVHPLALAWACTAIGLTTIAGLVFFNHYATTFVGLVDIEDEDDEDDEGL